MTEVPQPQQQQAVFLSTTAASRQPLPKQLTAAIKSCSSLDRLAQLFYAHQVVLNPIHIAAMLTKLPKLDTSMHTAAAAPGADLPWILSTASAQQVKLQQLLQQLLARLKIQGCSEYSPRGVANIIWALAKLQYAPDPELRQMLLDKFCSELASAVPQDVSNVLWGVAKLTKERTAPLANRTTVSSSSLSAMQPLVVTGGSYPSPTSSNNPSLGSSILGVQDWGATGVAPPVAPSGMDPSSAAASTPILAQDQVRLLLQHLCQQLQIASVQTISNSLWAVVVLQQEHQWCMCNCLSEVQALLSVFCKQPQQALPGHIQPVIRCMAQLATTCSNHAGDRWIKWQSPLLQQLLDYLCSQREHMEMHHVSSVLRDVAQIVCLHLLLAKQQRNTEQRTQQQQQQSDSSLVESSGGNGPSAASMALLNHPLQLAADADNRTGPSSGSAVPSLNTITAEQEAEDVLARLAATGGPQDASSTVVALGMLQPQLEQLGLKRGVAGLCSLLPAGALPHLGEEIGQRLLAAASSAAVSPSTPAPSTPAPSTIDARHLQYIKPQQDKQLSAEGYMQHALHPTSAVPTPTARPASSSEGTTSSGSNVDNSGMTTAAGAGSVATTSGVVVVYNPGLPVAGASPPTTEAYGLAGQPVDDTFSAQIADAVQHFAAASMTTSSTHPAVTDDDVDPVVSQGASALGTPLHSGCLDSAATSAEVLDFRIGLTTGEASDDVRTTVADDSQEEAAARQLTHNIAYADSVYQLAEIFDAHSSVMDMIHITACITRLSKVLGTAPAAPVQRAASALLPLVGAKLLQVLPHANARGIANVLWGYGRLKILPQSDLICKLVEAFTARLPTAACRDSAVVLWSLARLTESLGMAHTGMQPELLQRLGTAVMQQLATAAVAAGTAPAQSQAVSPQQRSDAMTRSSSARSDIGISSGGAESTVETSRTVSSRDVSNSLMALNRLGFVPERAEESQSPAPAEQSAAEQSTSIANSIAAQLDVLSLNTITPAVDSAVEEQLLGTQQQQVVSAAASTGSPHALILPLKAIETVVEFLLQHAASAKTLDLQEAATALKQMGLLQLHARVSAAIAAMPSVSSSSSIAHHGMLHSQGSASSPSLHQQPQGSVGAGKDSSTASPVHSRLLLAGSSSQGGSLSARSNRPSSGSVVSVPGAINLSGTQLAGLLQQQRRQQPLPVSGPAYGAGWLGTAAAASSGQQQMLPSGQGGTQQRQQRFPSGASGRSAGPVAGNLMLRNRGGVVGQGIGAGSGPGQGFGAGSGPGQGFGASTVPGGGVLGSYGVQSGPTGYSGNQPGFGVSRHQQQQLQQRPYMQQQVYTPQSVMQQQQQQQQLRDMLQQQQVLGSAHAQYTYVPPSQHGSAMLQQSLMQQQQQQLLSGSSLVDSASSQLQQAVQSDQQLMNASALSTFSSYNAPGTAGIGSTQAHNAALATGTLPWVGQSDLSMGYNATQLQQQQQQQRQGLVLSSLHGQLAGAVSPAQAMSLQTSAGLMLPQSFASVDPAFAAAAGISAFTTSPEQQVRLQPYNVLPGGNSLQLSPQQQVLGGQAVDAMYLLQQQQQQQVPVTYSGGVMVNPLAEFLPGGQF